MFFSLSLATYYMLSSLTRNCSNFLGIRRAHYILPQGSFERRPPFKDQKRKPSSRGFPIEDTSDLICLTSGQIYLRDDLYKNFLDFTLHDQQQIFIDFLLKELEDPETPFQFKGDFGIQLLPPAPQIQTPPFQQDDTTSTWTDAFGYHTQQSMKMTFQGFTVTCETYTFVSLSGSTQVEDTTETLSDSTGAKSAMKTVHKWTDGQSSYLKQTKLMHYYIQEREVYSREEEVKQINYCAVFGLTSERTENNTEHSVVAGQVTTNDQTFASTETKNNGVTTRTNTKSGSQRTITDDKTTRISYEEVESSTNGLSMSGRENRYQSFQSEDMYQYNAFSRTTNRDGSSTWKSSEAILRPKDSFFYVKDVFPQEGDVDIFMEDELHRYLQH